MSGYYTHRMKQSWIVSNSRTELNVIWQCIIEVINDIDALYVYFASWYVAQSGTSGL